MSASVWMIRTAPAQPTYVSLPGAHGGLNARVAASIGHGTERHPSGLPRKDGERRTGPTDPSRDTAKPRLDAGAR